MKNVGLVDLHTHILPGMDDGSKNRAMSLQMLRVQGAAGVQTVCATSHYYAADNTIEEFCARRAAACRRLRGDGLPADLPQILPAAEVAYFPRISETEGLRRLCLPHTRVLMLEMPFCEWNDFQIEEVNALALDLGYRLVLVHPERFCFSKGNRSRLAQLAALSVGLQVNAGSLLRWRTRKLALELLQMTDLPLLGSDCHNLDSRPPNLGEGRNVVEKKLGADFLHAMDENARQLVSESFAAV